MLSEHCLHRDSDRGLFWQYFSYIWKSSRCKGSRKASHSHAQSLRGSQTTRTPKLYICFSLCCQLQHPKVTEFGLKHPTAGNHSRPQCSHDCCSPHLLLAMHPHSQSRCWCRGSEASRSTGITEMSQSTTNQEKHWPSSLLYM